MNMKPEDLRIGNLITTGFGDCVVSGISDKGTAIYLKSEIIESGFVLINDVKPIELTAEWFVRLGLKYNSSLHTWDKEEWFCIEEEYDRDDYKRYRFLFENYQIQIPDLRLKYVHEVQNLYFVFVGRDLAVAPPCP